MSFSMGTFLIGPLSLEARAEIEKYFRSKTSKFAFEIKWPLVDGHVHRRGIMPLLYSHEYFEMGLSIGVCNAHGYANMGCQISKGGIQNSKKKLLYFDNWCSLTLFKTIKSFKNWSYQKMTTTKKGVHKKIVLLWKKINRKLHIILDIGNWHSKSDFYTFWPVHKIQYLFLECLFSSHKP